MTQPPITDAQLQAWIDGQLDADATRALEAWLADRPEEAARVAALRAQRDALRAHFLPVLDESIPETMLRATGHPQRRWWQAAAVIAALAIGAAAGLQFERASHPQAEAPVVHESLPLRAAIAHATYSPEVRHPVEVGADQEAHLVAWLSKRLGAPIRAPKLEDVGYSLVGGRLLPGDRGPVAHFMYQCKAGTRVTLYLRTSAAGQNETAFRYTDEGKVKVFYWIDRKFGYALSSADIDKDLLFKVANSVYRQYNP